MIDIYLCDDDLVIRRQIEKVLEKKILIEDYDMTILCSAADPWTLIDTLRQRGGKRGIFFLDVDLKDDAFDGFLLGQEIRRLDPHATLVYITSYGDLAWRTFQYHLEVFDYIVKDPDKLESSILHCLEDIHLHLLSQRRDPTEIFTLRAGDTVRHVFIRDILYFETAPTPHHVLLHTSNSRLDFVGSLNELATQLGEAFIRTHRAYLVAADKIDTVDLKKNRLFVGAQECLLSRAGKSELRKRMGGRL